MMTDFSDAADFLDGWPADQHERYVADLHGELDVEAGLREILLADRHEDYVAVVNQDLDVETGLAAIVAPASEPEGVEELSVGSAGARSWTDRDPHLMWKFRTALMKCGLNPARQKVGAYIMTGYGDPALMYSTAALMSAECSHIFHVAMALEDYYIEASTMSEKDAGFIDSVQSRFVHARNSFEFILGRARDLGLPDEVGNLPAFRAVRADFTSAIRGFLELVRDLNDFAGADLRSVRIDESDLDGARWSAQTVWPDAVRDTVILYSVEVGDGIFLVQRDGIHDRDVSFT